ncbi:transcriptional regulator [Streptomyces fagopyri]|uniref:transcriptional regulator n=1 Tax=Streptomyces fagopyri TaxID=2662397 RepID=UPI0034110674
MRSMEDPTYGSRATPPPPSLSGRQAQARRAGAYLTAVATAAGYDVRPRQGGRAQLAALTGLSLTTISRTLDGKTLPLPSQLTTWATVLNLDHRRMLVETGHIPEQRGTQDVNRETAPEPLSPDEAMDMWGITDPIIRKTLSGSIVQAIRLQEELDAADGLRAVVGGG